MMLKKKYMEFLNRFVEYKINESNNDIKKCSSVSKNMYIILKQNFLTIVESRIGRHELEQA